MDAPHSSLTEADLEDFFENAAVGLHIVSGAGIILRANRAELEMLGYSAEEYLGRQIAEFHADQPVINDILQRLASGEKLEKYPARLRAKDGSIRHVQITSSALIRQGKFIQTRCFTVDVTDTVRAEQRFQQVLDALPAAVYTTDAEGYVTYYNQPAVELAGRRPQVGVDQWCVTWRLRTEDGAPLPLEECPMAIALKEKRPVRGIVAWAVRPDGTLVPFMPYPTPLFDDTGKLTGAINMLVDMTARKRAEETQKLLLNELNHRVKNTLAIVQALAHQTLRRAASPNDFVASFSGRLGALSRAHTLLSDTTWMGAEFSKLLKDELLLGEEFDGRISWSGPPVLLEPQQALNVALILHELATNARKYGALSKSEGELEVSWLVKRNGGRSLHMSWAERNSPAMQAPLASGFGTTFIQQIVSSNGGSAQMSCEANGIMWDIKLVLRSSLDVGDEISEIERSGLEPASRPTLHNKRILIVEDEALIAMELEEVVRSAGAEVDTAGQLNEAISKAESGSYDAVLLDISLDRRRSDELADLLQQRRIPFAFVSGYRHDGLTNKFQHVPLIGKPFGRDEVLNTLASLFLSCRVVPFRSSG